MNKICGSCDKGVENVNHEIKSKQRYTSCLFERSERSRTQEIYAKVVEAESPP